MERVHFTSIYKKGEEADCCNYQHIVMNFIQSNIILLLTPYTGEIVEYQHHGCWCNRSTADWISCICQITGEKMEQYICCLQIGGKYFAVFSWVSCTHESN
jgi:hypothetical protein